MSETRKSRQIPDNTINYIVFGKENELELTATGKEQMAVHTIPGIPMEITVEPHSFEILPNGEIVRKGRNGEKLPGKVTSKKVTEALKENREER